jgi:hypothetical protein
MTVDADAHPAWMPRRVSGLAGELDLGSDSFEDRHLLERTLHGFGSTRFRVFRVLRVAGRPARQAQAARACPWTNERTRPERHALAFRNLD